MDPLKETLLRDIEAFCVKHAMSSSKFGQLAVKDHKLYARLRAGGVTTTTIARIRGFMESFDAAGLDATTEPRRAEEAA